MPSHPKLKKAGRPPLPKGNAKAVMLRVRITRDEQRAIEARAKAEEKTVSQWIRHMLEARLAG
jgi:predicted HicB family RNase H-like nuclease